MPRAFASGRVKVVFSITGLPNAVRACAVCGIVFPTRRYYAAHVSTPQHLQAVAQLPRPTVTKPRPKPTGTEARNRSPYAPTSNSNSNSRATFCKTCRVQCRTPQAFQEHLAGRRHAQRLAGTQPRGGEDATRAGGQDQVRRPVRRRPRRGPRGRWQVLSPEAILWLQTRKAEQAVQQRQHIKRVAQLDGDRTVRAETRRKRRLRRANDRVGQARGWKAHRNGQIALAHARPQGKPGAAPVRLKKRDDREVYICAACGVTYVKRAPYEAHMASARHALAVQCVERPPSLPSWCAVCKMHLSLPSWRGYDEHIEGKAHKRNAARTEHLAGPLDQPPQPPAPPAPPAPSIPLARFRREPPGQNNTLYFYELGFTEFRCTAPELRAGRYNTGCPWQKLQRW